MASFSVVGVLLAAPALCRAQQAAPLQNKMNSEITPSGERSPMPIYEYYCYDCAKRVNVFFRTMSEASDEAAACPTCSGRRLRRLVSRVRMLRSEEGRMESMADDASLMSGLESEDPRALAGFMRRMSDEMGEPLDGEMTEMIDLQRAYQTQQKVIQTIDDLDSQSISRVGKLT